MESKNGIKTLVSLIGKIAEVKDSVHKHSSVQDSQTKYEKESYSSCEEVPYYCDHMIYCIPTVFSL